jgi:lysyl-tRNA synthetase class 2
MSWRPGASLQTLRRRAALLAETRLFFGSRGVLEVETPALVPHAVTDPHLENIRVQLGAAPMYLHTSPEFHMKRLLAAGAPDIWQLCKVFRHGESGRRHQPEFTMVEWYRHGFALADMARETCDLVAALGRRAAAEGAPGLAATAPTTYTYAGLFRKVLGLDPLAATHEQIVACAGHLLGGALTPALEAALGGERTLWLDLLMSHAVAGHLATEPLAVVTGYPAGQAALARLDPADTRVAERFEVFCLGVEIANGYRELTDPEEQARRFTEDGRFRDRLGRPAVVPDNDLLAALRHGLPDCAGVAVGFDRVVMILLGLDALQEAVSFPVA